MKRLTSSRPLRVVDVVLQVTVKQKYIHIFNRVISTIDTIMIWHLDYIYCYSDVQNNLINLLF